MIERKRMWVRRRKDGTLTGVVDGVPWLFSSEADAARKTGSVNETLRGEPVLVTIVPETEGDAP